MTRCTVCHEPIYRATPETTPGHDTPTGWRHVAGDEARQLCHWAMAEEDLHNHRPTGASDGISQGAG